MVLSGGSILGGYDKNDPVLELIVSLSFSNGSALDGLCAILDTGSQITAISEQALSRFDIAPLPHDIGEVRAIGRIESGSAIYDGCVLRFPNNVTFGGIELWSVPSLPHSADLLIGMDVLTGGNLYVCHDGSFSFFVEESG